MKIQFTDDRQVPLLGRVVKKGEVCEIEDKEALAFIQNGVAVSVELDENKEKKEDKEKKEETPVFDWKESAIIFIVIVMMAIGGYYLLRYADPDIGRYVIDWKFVLKIIAYGLLGFAALFLIAFVAISLDSKKNDGKFADIDTKQDKKEKEDKNAPSLRQEINELRQTIEELKQSPSKASQIPQDSGPPAGPGDPSEHPEHRRLSLEIQRTQSKAFVLYFEDIISILQNKSDIADKKASLLLDRGIRFTKGGIYFFVISIIFWQVMFWEKGFKKEFLLGIVSCSVLFIFIEFLSAWFLKQYRHFVDTSTYYLKIKSIFDRYALTYHAIKEYHDDLNPEHPHTKHIFSMLSEEIKWPDNLVVNGKDVSFAKEAMEAMTEIVKNLKAETKSKRKPKLAEESE